MCTIKLILAICNQPYQPICSSGGCDSNLKVSLNFKAIHRTKIKPIYKYIFKKEKGNVSQYESTNIVLATLNPVHQTDYHREDFNFFVTKKVKNTSNYSLAAVFCIAMLGSLGAGVKHPFLLLKFMHFT